MAEQDLDFYRRRLTEERERQSSATCIEARTAHARLAAIYDDCVTELANQQVPAQGG